MMAQGIDSERPIMVDFYTTIKANIATFTARTFSYLNVTPLEHGANFLNIS
jgi:hypothetical protein